ncbi:hypothetical protein SLS60_002255 [Paraconiothyrium brasiliense]|uniref:Uncharacterized protein n=1 Tax=Paraconiothyrium brasiliense TaxID=300254 RepID=A0ABR3S1N9_9PLEO
MRPNFALRRANTLDTCLEQDDDHVSDDNSEDDSEGSECEVSECEDEDEDEEEDIEDDDGETEYYDDDDEQEDTIDKALGQLEKSLRGDKRGLKALQLLWQYV